MRFYQSILSLGFLLLVSYASFAGKVDTVSTFSKAMKKEIKSVIITPQSYSDKKQYPVVYLLHGYSDNYSAWVKKVKGLADWADTYQLIMVCADGGFSSWYWDSEVDSSFKYETYIAKELVEFVDSHYQTIRNKKGRAITGLSMGGHGALYLAIKHQDVFGAAGSIAGGVDIRPFPNNWDMSKRLGNYAEYPEVWERHTVINLLHQIRPQSLSLIVDCGIDDFFYKVNEHLHEELLYRNIPHDYISKPGRHDWNYFGASVIYHLLFFNNYFVANQSK